MFSLLIYHLQKMLKYLIKYLNSLTNVLQMHVLLALKALFN